MKCLKDPVCEEGSLRVGRGGSWVNVGRSCQASRRVSSGPERGTSNLGLRLAISGDKMKVLINPRCDEGSNRVYRGGSWSNSAENCRAASRGISDPANSYINLGLRLTADNLTAEASTELDSLLFALADDWTGASLVLSDWYEEHGDTPTATVIRLTRAITLDVTTADDALRRWGERRILELNAQGVYMPLPIIATVVGGVPIPFRLTPPGFFWLGPPDNRKRVLISKPFWLGVTHVTQAQWQAVMGNNPSRFKGDNHPVETVSWDDCTQMIAKLSDMTGITHRLPTDAEWEYACRAGSTSLYHFGDDPGKDNATLKEYAWFADNSDNTTHPVGQLKPNAWGLYDINGNVWSWVQDRFQSDFFDRLWVDAKDEVIDPVALIGGVK